ncbi:MAG: flavodoxin [Clostridiales Family XIII bacterium]|jgi:flavodoxin|nr:flavodoxin [Clostridiales Family XIII bacterium]
MSKTLVAYFSCSGVTEKSAITLASMVNGDVYKIEPAVPYTEADLNWHDPKARSTIEMKDKKSRPEIAGIVRNMDEYEVVYIGFPIWWYIAPTIINTFLESYDFSGKTVIPFATSGMSGVGETDKWLHSSCSNETKWRPAKRFGANSELEIKTWVNATQGDGSFVSGIG